jgi:hypothetical protein
MLPACPAAPPKSELHIGWKRTQAGIGASIFCIRKAGRPAKLSAGKTEKGGHQAAFAHA